MRTKLLSRLDFLDQIRQRKIQSLGDKFRDLVIGHFSSEEISLMDEAVQLSILGRDEEITPEQQLIIKKLFRLGCIDIIMQMMALKTGEELFIEDLKSMKG